MPASLKELTSGAARILIVDDEETNLTLLRRFLELAEYENVDTTADPTAVVPLVEAGEYDIILLDLHMPVMDGFSVLERLQNVIAERPLPVLVLTADVTEETKLRALELGAFYFLTKPFDRKELILRVENLVADQMRDQRMLAEKLTLENRLSEIAREAEKAKLETLEQLARAAECRDEDTAQHVSRVGELTRRIAVAMGVPGHEAELLFRAAPLHDIGKLGIPDAILLKPGRLTDEEFAIMKQHTIIGSHILSGSTSGLMQLADQITLTHHERWDGAGYPHRLKGPSIPLGGRVVAVADVFDALTHDRPYKKAWSRADAIDLIRRGAGSQFDPAVVDGFMKTLK